MQESRQRMLWRVGLFVFILGTLSNITEYTLANTVQQGVMIPIIILALIDTVCISYVFMHISQLWHPEE